MKTKQRRRKGARPAKAILDEIVRRVVDAAQPDNIILFGSAARGEMGPDSDIDLLIVKKGIEGTHAVRSGDTVSRRFRSHHAQAMPPRSPDRGFRHPLGRAPDWNVVATMRRP